MWKQQYYNRYSKGGPGGEEVFVLGTHKEQRAAALEDGEVYLFSERASICLRNNGTIELTGQLLINGEAYAPCDCGAGCEVQRRIRLWS